LVSAADTNLYLITDSCQVAADEVVGFYRNYDSLRYVGDQMVIRLKRAPSIEQLVAMNEQFAHLCKSASIALSEPFEPERRENDRLDLARISFVFRKHGYGDLRELIDYCNTF